MDEHLSQEGGGQAPSPSPKTVARVTRAEGALAAALKKLKVASRPVSQEAQVQEVIQTAAAASELDRQDVAGVQPSSTGDEFLDGLVIPDSAFEAPEPAAEGLADASAQTEEPQAQSSPAPSEKRGAPSRFVERVGKMFEDLRNEN